MSDDPLDTLNDRISSAKIHAHDAAHSTMGDRSGAKTDRADSNLSSGMRAGTEFIGGIVGGILFGACADWMFGIGPYGLIIGATLGTVAGFYGVYRTTQ